MGITRENVIFPVSLSGNDFSLGNTQILSNSPREVNQSLNQSFEATTWLLTVPLRTRVMRWKMTTPPLSLLSNRPIKKIQNCVGSHAPAIQRWLTKPPSHLEPWIYATWHLICRESDPMSCHVCHAWLKTTGSDTSTCCFLKSAAPGSECGHDTLVLW